MAKRSEKSKDNSSLAHASEVQETAKLIETHETDADVLDLLDDALNDFVPRADHSSSHGVLNKPSNSRFDPLQKERQRQNERGSQSKSSSSESQQSEAKQRFDPLGNKKARGGLTPLPAQKGKKAQKQQSSGDSANSEQAFAAQLGKLMQELAVAEEGVGSKGENGEQKEMSETLRALSQEASRIQSQASAEASSSGSNNLTEPMFAGLQDQIFNGDQGGMGGMADALMRQLLSKDVLYQPLKEIGEQYPAWLDKNRGKISAEELRNYEQQFHHIQQILHIYEHDGDNYSNLFQELHQMQQCGQPPEDIVKELAPGMSFDNEGLPKLPGDLSGCVIQ